MPNQTLLNDTYQILGQIGSGSGGVVYKAYHNRLEKEVVLKQIKGEMRGLTADRHEADLLKNLKHAYLPQVYDFLEIDREVYTVMDFMPGKSLEQELQEMGRLKQREVLKWAIQLSEALCYLHKKNPPIIHSDIKPANIMLTAQRDICLIDFNVSLLFTSDASALGHTLAYAPPEQRGFISSQDRCGSEQIAKTEFLGKTEIISGTAPFQYTGDTEVLIEPDMLNALHYPNSAEGQKYSYSDWPNAEPKYTRMQVSSGIHVDERSDIFSLCATLYHLLTGEKPNPDYSQIKPIDSFGIHLSDGIKHIISKGMQYDPSKRYQSAGEMLHALQSIKKLDRRYTSLKLQREIVTGIVIVSLTGFSWLAQLGNKTMQHERLDKYNDYISAGENAQNSGDFEIAEADFNKAIEFMPNKIDAYYHYAYSLSQQPDADPSECLSFIEKTLSDNHFEIDNANGDMRYYSDIYFIAANSCFETEDYSKAITYYKMAIEGNNKNSEYYRDLAISYARMNKLNQAEEALQRAVDCGLETDSISLVDGEIKYVQRNYADAENELLKVIKSAENDETKLRAYVKLYEMYKDPEATFNNALGKEIALLEEAKSNLPKEQNGKTIEYLAAAYAEMGDNDPGSRLIWYNKAVSCFEELFQRGLTSFEIMQNCAILYHEAGQYNKAETLLLSMEDLFPEDYRVPMRLAFLYADMEYHLSNDQRDYSQTKACYDEARVLYQKAQNSGKSDPEMQNLENLINDLRNNNWF